MRGSVKAAIAAIVVALGIGVLLAGWDNEDVAATARSGNVTEGRAATAVDPANPDEPVIRDVAPGESTR